VLNETGLRRILNSYFEYYERTRTHLSLNISDMHQVALITFSILPSPLSPIKSHFYPVDSLEISKIEGLENPGRFGV
jgi:hypothetical protein